MKPNFIKHLQSMLADYFKALCNDFSKVQCLTKTDTGSGNREHEKKDKDKEVQLTSTTVNKTCGHCHKKGHFLQGLLQMKEEIGQRYKERQRKVKYKC